MVAERPAKRMKLAFAILLLLLVQSVTISGARLRRRAEVSDPGASHSFPDLREDIPSERSDGRLITAVEGFDPRSHGHSIPSDLESRISNGRRPGSRQGHLVTSNTVRVESADTERFFASDSEVNRGNHQVDACLVSRLPSNSDTHAEYWGNDTDDAPAIWITVAQRGLDYLKDVLLTQVLETVTPLSLPSITKSMSIPFMGDVTVYFTNVTLVHAEVPLSTIALGNTGISIQGSNGAVNLTLDWHYTYENMWLPGPISDAGGADIKVVGMQAGVSMNVQDYMGTLHLNVVDCGTYIKKLAVHLNGESSWLYQWLMNGLEEHMRTTIEEQLSAQIQDSIQNLNSFLLDMPQRVEVDDMSELNFTVVSEPIVSPTSISIGVKGKFNGRQATTPDCKHATRLPPGLVCSGNSKMATISLSESVFKDGAAIYYNADLLNWLVDKMPEQAFLNTSKWKFLIPELYLNYPNEEIKIGFEVLAPPDITLTLDGVDLSAAARMNIGVVNNDTVTQVACINVTAAASGMTSLHENNITGQVTLKDLNLELEWSNVGKIHLALVKVFVKALVKDVLLPYLNLSLRRGFPLPMLPNLKLEDPTISYGYGFLLVCTDVQYVKDPHFAQ